LLYKVAGTSRLIPRDSGKRLCPNCSPRRIKLGVADKSDWAKAMDSAEEIEKNGKPERVRPYTEALLKSRLVQTTKLPLARPHAKALRESRLVRLVVVNG
jgi:hypothetical protein